MDKLIQKIEQKLVELGIVKMAEEPASSGTTSGATAATSAAPAVVVSEIIPKTIKISYSAIGAPVIQTNEDGKEENVTDGEYILTTNKKITIESGKLVKEEDVVEDEKKEDEKEESVSGETKMSFTSAELAEKLEMANVEKKRLSEIIDLSKAGEYTINISINDKGEITWGTLYATTYENLLMAETEKVNAVVDELTQAFETKMSAEKSKYENIIEALKTGEIKVMDKPVQESEPVKLSRAEALKKGILAKKAK